VAWVQTRTHAKYRVDKICDDTTSPAATVVTSIFQPEWREI
jgi:hypothetical protein